MATDDPKDEQASTDTNSGEQESGEASDSTPSDDVQAPPSGSFQKAAPSQTIPDENIEAPKSQVFREGFEFDKNEPETE